MCYYIIRVSSSVEYRCRAEKVRCTADNVKSRWEEAAPMTCCPKSDRSAVRQSAVWHHAWD